MFKNTITALRWQANYWMRIFYDSQKTNLNKWCCFHILADIKLVMDKILQMSTFPSCESNIESDFISLWMTPFECKKASAFRQDLQTVAICCSSILQKKEVNLTFYHFRTKLPNCMTYYKLILPKVKENNKIHDQTNCDKCTKDLFSNQK